MLRHSPPELPVESDKISKESDSIQVARIPNVINGPISPIDAVKRCKTNLRSSGIRTIHSFGSIEVYKMKPTTDSKEFRYNLKRPTTVSIFGDHDEEQEKHRILFRILSNYGDESQISFSEIDILDSGNIPVKVVSAGIFPNMIYSDELKKLFNHQLISDSDTELWHHEWPVSRGRIDLFVDFVSNDNDFTLRLWPNFFKPKSNIKHMQIILDEAPTLETDVSNIIGSTIRLPQIDKNGAKLFEYVPEHTSPYLKDNYGLLPNKSSLYFEFHIHSVYNGRNKFGINLIRFYDTCGRIIDSKTSGTFGCNNCGELSDLSVIFSPVEDQLKFIGDFSENSYIYFNFFSRIRIIAVEILNLYDPDICSNIGVKKASIRFDGITRWVGKIPMRRTEKAESFMIHFTENRDIVAKVLESRRLASS